MREDVVAAARLWLGTPYRHQAAVRGIGCDCLGLVRGVWSERLGPLPVTVPPYRADIRDTANAGRLLEMARTWLTPAAGPPQPGQVVLFRLRRALEPRHCGIMSAPDRFIHAQEGLGVVEAALGESWRARVFASFDFPERT